MAWTVEKIGGTAMLDFDAVLRVGVPNMPLVACDDVFC